MPPGVFIILLTCYGMLCVCVCVCVCVELQEESGLTAPSLEKVGVLLFEFVNEPPVMEVHVFRTSEFTGEPTESEGLCTRVPNIV